MRLQPDYEALQNKLHSSADHSKRHKKIEFVSIQARGGLHSVGAGWGAITELVFFITGRCAYNSGSYK